MPKPMDGAKAAYEDARSKLDNLIANARWGRSNACGKCGEDSPVVAAGMAIMDEVFEITYGPEGFEYDGVA